ncbi:MAG: MarR family winged helix-turn-helix transcriptional regulator [Pseudomonadota bacterium]|uniref:MarR family winged helix-turn-helix transcriptional regulator n=1 Tax=Sphingomonas sp. ERG5 TaxID=1381597 RepID=UPI00054BAC8F|nr:MarR family winged helix-turn-helix transcriptional regulator [Sphingomonas sp. ERG5]
MSNVANNRRGRFIYLLNVAQRRVQAAVQDEGDGATAARAGLLMALSPDMGTPMAQLGPILDLGAPALSGLIDRTSRAGLIERCPDPADGRAWIILLTAEGAAARAEAIRGAHALNERLCNGFDDAELAIVARWLEAVRDKFPKENGK